ncbi:DUF6527 family protein [Paraburkholderia fynbosensis]|nr:DUF6527 family protein [Paraburkholderia fynbosensis]
MRLHQITPELVELAPRDLQPGRLYISNKYRAAVHLCCCGCGEKVVTPLSAAEWQAEVSHGYATLHPSIGNGAMTCMSHYLIRNNRVVWCTPLSKMQAKTVFARDQRDLHTLHRSADSVAYTRDVAPSTELPKIQKVNRWGRLRAIWRWLTS